MIGQRSAQLRRSRLWQRFSACRLLSITRYLRNCQGFTLLELVIVTLVLGLMTEIVGVNFIGQLPKRRLNGATRKIALELMAGRMEAVTKNYRVGFIFDESNHTYSVWTDVDNDEVADPEEKETRDIQTNYPGVTFTTTNNPVFSPRGGTNGLSEITVANTQGSTKKVEVAITGKIKME